MSDNNRTIRQKSCRPASGRGGNCGPLVTVLISTYNRPMYLAEALESIFRQSYPNFEIILTRDGGQPVKDVVSRFDDSRLTFIDRDENRGLPRSFNEALSVARGEYVCYLGDDDKFYPHHIETLLQTIQRNPDYGAVYGDLYKTHCRVLSDGRRRVLAKNIEISRDYDRLLMLQFNHALHVSILHRRDIFDRAGGYNENLNVLIDWDLTRKLCFYTDFLHVPIVTGEYYAPVGDCDRISVQRRKNVSDYLRNLLTIRTTRPPKAWPKIKDMAIVIPAMRVDSTIDQMLRDIWSHNFYPYQIYVPVTAQEQGGFKTCVPNVVPVIVSPQDSSAVRLSKMLSGADAQYCAILTPGIAIPRDEAMYIERSLYPLMQQKRTDIAFEIIEADESHFGAAVLTETLRDAVRRYPAQNAADSLCRAGVEIRKPEFKEYPFQFDNLLSAADLSQLDGEWLKAAKIYDYMAEHYGNAIWMQTRRANALYYGGRYMLAAETARSINQIRPTAASFIIEARAEKKLNHHLTAAGLYRQALGILEGKSNGYLSEKSKQLIPYTQRQELSRHHQEILAWT